MENNYFEKLYNIDVRAKTKKKNGLNYLSWAAAWAEVKKIYPDATYHVFENSNERPWFDDGKSAWVKTSVTINGITHTEDLAIMDFKNKSMAAEDVTSVDANKSIQRCLTKACARHGLGLYIYEGEDLPEGTKKQMNEEAEQLKKDLAAIHKEMVSVINEKIKSGVSRDAISDFLSKDGGNKNPNAIKDMELCKRKLEGLKNIK